MTPSPPSRSIRAAPAAAVAPFLAAFALLAGVARADEPPRPGAQLLAGLAPADARLLGDAVYGVYRRGRSVGVLRLQVRATEDGGYQVSLGGVLRAGSDDPLGLDETGTLDRRLAPIALEQRVVEGEREAEVVRLARRGGRLQVETALAPGPPRRDALPLEPALVAGLAVRFLLPRLPAAGSHTFAEVALEDVVRRDLLLEVEAAPTVWDGIACRTVLLRPPGPERTGSEWAWRCYVRADGPVVQAVVPLGERGLAYVLVVDEAAAARDRPYGPAAGTPAAAVWDLLRALARGDGEAAQPLVDWPALQRALGEGGEVEAFRASFLGGLSEGAEEGALDPDDVEDLGPLLVEEVEGDAALVRVPGEAGPFRLARSGPGAPWRVTDVPR